MIAMARRTRAARASANRRKTSRLKAAQESAFSPRKFLTVFIAVLVLIITVFTFSLTGQVTGGGEEDQTAIISGLTTQEEAQKYENARGSYYSGLYNINRKVSEALDDLTSQESKNRLGEAKGLVPGVTSDFLYMCTFIKSHTGTFEPTLYDDLRCDSWPAIYASCLPRYIDYMSSFSPDQCRAWVDGYNVLRSDCGWALDALQMSAGDLSHLCSSRIILPIIP